MEYTPENKILNEINIVNKVDEFKLFKHYFLPSLELGKKYSAPYRDDKHPSFSVFAANRGTNKYMWKDHSTGESGNVFKLIMFLYDVDYFTALAMVNRDFNLGLDEDRVETINVDGARQKVNQVTVQLSKSTRTEVSDIQIVKKEWTEDTLHYWKSRYDLNLEYLQHYNVHSVDRVYLNGNQIMGHFPANPIYAYSFLEEGEIRYKIYKPLEPNKQYKFLGNTSSKTIQGYEQLKTNFVPVDDIIFITSSLKDVMVLRKLGWFAVAPNSETTDISGYIINEIQPWTTEEVVLFYDNDETGINFAENMCNKLPNNISGYIHIPQEFEAKDISDFVEIYGYKEARILIESLL